MKGMRWLVLACLVGSTTAQAADTKVGGRMYNTWMYDLTKSTKGENTFSLDRTYLDVKSSLSEYTTGRLTSDLKQSTVDGKSRYDVIIKYAYFDWKPKFGQSRLTLRMGMQPTLYIDYQTDLWGRRYLLKAVGDEHGVLTSSDLGASAMVGLGEKGKVGTLILSTYNGTSYSNLGEMNKRKDINALVVLKPLTKNPDFERTTLIAQGYFGTQNKAIPDSIDASDWKHNIISAGGLLAYRHTFDVGVDANFVSDGTGPDSSDTKWVAHSAFATLYFQDLVNEKSALRTLNLWARVDFVDPNTDTDDDATTYTYVGVECVPVSGFKASVNYRQAKPQYSAAETQKGLFVNTEFKF